MSLRLRIEHGQDAGKTWRLPSTGVYSLGRVPQNSIRVLDMKVSKMHCELRVADEGGTLHAALHDPGSTHGCELNGQPVPKGKSIPMKPGDELRLGMTILRLLSAGDSDEDAQPLKGRNADEPTAAPGNGGGTDAGATRQTLPPDALVGTTLGGYKIEKKIGAGGMGGVYLAEQVSLNRKVALKVLNETFAADSAFIDQFVNEARAAGALNHPNVVQVYDVGNDQGHYYFSMEVMPGGSLEDKIKEGPVEWAVGLNWFLDSTNALIFAKRREILHRDVKPDNLMIGEDESAKLCDLGLAKKSEVADLMDQGIIGTPHFISPEAVRRKGDIDHRTDLYSLGCTFYRVFTGKNPYPAGTVKEIILGHLNKPVPHANALNADLPKEIDEAIAKLMAKDPEERFQTPEDLLRELDKIRTRYNLEAHGIKPASRKPLVIGAVAAVIAIGVAIFFATREPEVITTKKTKAEIERENDGRRAMEKSTLTSVLTDASKRYLEKFTRYSNGKIDDEENWKKKLFRDLSAEAKADAETWSRQIATWTKKKATLKDTKLVQIYADAIEALAGHAASMSKIHTDIEATLGERKQNETKIKEGKKKALEDANAFIKKQAAAIKAHYDEETDGSWIELEKTVRADGFAPIVEELLARRVGRFPLIDQKAIDKILNKHAPITKKDAPRGSGWVDKAARLIDGKRIAFLKEVQRLLGDKPVHKEFSAARKRCQAFLDALPQELDAQLAAAPQVVAALKRSRDAVKRLLESTSTRYHAYIAAEYASDRGFYFRLAGRLWQPEEGYLPRFNFAEARTLVEQTQALVKVKGYRDLVAHWLPLIDSLEGLFNHMVEGQKSGWTGNHYSYIDKRGKTKRARIRDISAAGVKWEKAIVPFHRSSPRFLLENLFFFEGKPRLSSCNGADHAGLGLLAELAGDYDIAGAQYMQAKGAQGASEALVAAVTDRLMRLQKEREAAERFYAIVHFTRSFRVWLAPLEEQVRDLERDPDAFVDREKAMAESVEHQKKMASMHEMLSDLFERADLATTMWGSSLRTSAHARAAYLGEVLPEPVKKKAPPRKGEQPKGKPGGANGGDAKDGDGNGRK